MPATDRTRYTIMVWNRATAPRFYGVYAMESTAAKQADRWRRKIIVKADWITVDVVAIRPATAAQRRNDWRV